jgi:hypothetical protein
MRTVVVVRGAVDERDLWPYASLSASAGGRSTLTVTVHDTQELVGVLAGLTALGLEVISTHLIDESARERGRTAISSSENDAVDEPGDDSDQQ